MSDSLPPIKLGEVVELQNGFAFKSKNFSSNPDDIPLVKGSNLGHREIRWEEGPWWPTADAEDHERFRLTTGDVVLAMDRPIVGGKLKYAWFSGWEPDALLVQRVCRLRGTERLEQRYLRYIIGSSAFQAHVERITTGVNVPHISGGDIQRFEMPLPSLDVQNRIADILSNYDDLIENNNRRIALLEEAIHLLYREWFVYLRFPGHERVEVIDGVPKRWSKSPLREVCDVTMGQSPKSEFYNEEGRGLPFHQGVKDYGDRFVSHRVFCTVENRIAEPGDILFSVRAPVGRLNITKDRIVIGRGLCAIHRRDGRQSFQFYQLKSHFHQEDLIGGGTIFASVTKKNLLDQEMLTPTESLIAEFETVASTADCQIKNLDEQNKRLSEARDLLLPRLMSGSILV